MSTLASRLALPILLAALVSGGLANCGGGDITIGGGGDGNQKAKVTVKGNLDAVSPVTTRDIVVFVYTMDDNADTCPCGVLPADLTTLVGKAAVLTSGTTKFTISSITPGKLLVVFLLDNAGTDADGEINAGDPIAILDDVDCVLDNVKGNITVTLTDVDMVFDDAPAAECQGVSDPPTTGRARARVITQAITTTTGN